MQSVHFYGILYIIKGYQHQKLFIEHNKSLTLTAKKEMKNIPGELLNKEDHTYETICVSSSGCHDCSSFFQLYRARKGCCRCDIHRKRMDRQKRRRRRISGKPRSRFLQSCALSVNRSRCKCRMGLQCTRGLGVSANAHRKGRRLGSCSRPELQGRKRTYQCRLSQVRFSAVCRSWLEDGAAAEKLDLSGI